ncbi:MAG: hypothetical protein PUK75_12870 [bacterium]|nr:hypothetical protein [bacterium]MDY4100546.1 DUF6715 family protein [Lachnospiraceae bacterium]
MTKKRGGVILLILIAVLIVGAFALVAYRTPKTAEEATEVTEKDALMSKNIEVSYPSTPREVLKLYNRYMVCLYGVESNQLTDDEVRTLGIKMRQMYDEELLEANQQESHLQKLTQEIVAFQADEKVMIQANVCDSNEVDYIDVDGASGALLEASYFIKKGSKEFSRTYQQYLMRKDANGNWKILGFVKVNGGEM